MKCAFLVAAKLPPQVQLDAVKELIDFGVDNGYIEKDYKLIGHRQVRKTECPGDRLYAEIQTWGHYCPTPAAPEKCAAP